MARSPVRWLAAVALLAGACSPYHVLHRVDPVPYARATPFAFPEDVPFDPSLASDHLARSYAETQARVQATGDQTPEVARERFRECLGANPHLDGLVVVPSDSPEAFQLAMTLTFHKLGVTRTAPVGAAASAESPDGSTTAQARGQRPQSGTTSSAELILEVRDPGGRLVDRVRLGESRFPGARESVEERVRILCEAMRREIAEYLHWRIQGGD